MFSALRKSLHSDRSPASVRANLLAGLTVGNIALPLSMVPAIAGGVPPQHGWYTVIIGFTAVVGVIIAILQIKDSLGLAIPRRGRWHLAGVPGEVVVDDINGPQPRSGFVDVARQSLIIA